MWQLPGPQNLVLVFRSPRFALQLYLNLQWLQTGPVPSPVSTFSSYLMKRLGDLWALDQPLPLLGPVVGATALRSLQLSGHRCSQHPTPWKRTQLLWPALHSLYFGKSFSFGKLLPHSSQSLCFRKNFSPILLLKGWACVSTLANQSISKWSHDLTWARTSHSFAVKRFRGSCSLNRAPSKAEPDNRGWRSTA